MHIRIAFFWCWFMRKRALYLLGYEMVLGRVKVEDGAHGGVAGARQEGSLGTPRQYNLQNKT